MKTSIVGKGGGCCFIVVAVVGHKITEKIWVRRYSDGRGSSDVLALIFVVLFSFVSYHLFSRW